MSEERQWSTAFAALRQLVLGFVDSDATEIDLQHGGLHLRARKGLKATSANVAPPRPAAAVAPSAPRPCIVSPLTGVVYLGPAPQAPPYVAPGDRVEVGQVVAVVEAMKVFNEVRAEHAGCAGRMLVSSGDLVQRGQPILELEE